MNIQEYISSGIIESYVLGLASEEERRDFEHMCNIHPEIKEARDSFERTLEMQAMKEPMLPPAHVKEAIWSQVGFNNTVTDTPGPSGGSPVVRLTWLRYAVAASILLLAGSFYWNFSLQRKNKEINEALVSTQKELGEVKNTLAGMEKEANLIQGNPNIKMASLNGMPASPRSLATVYWDTTSKDVYLLVNNLPKPATGQQYQLWALLDGKPIDMGMLTITEKPLQLYKMKNAQAAQAFAITLEKKGGNPTPRGPMFVMGKL